MKPLAISLCVAALLAQALLAADPKKDPGQIGNRDVAKGINIYSIEKEIALGKQLAQEVTRQAKMVDDPIIGEFVNRLGQNLARNSDAKMPFSFQIIDDPILNAFALPGGFIFVNSGLLRAAETEAELAGAISHEVAHVAARHMTRQATQRELVNWASLPLIFLGGWTGYAARQAAGVGIPMTFLSFGRKYENEADMLGMQYAYHAGYDPTAAIDLFERMQSLERTKPGTISRVFSTHPMNQDRIANAQKQIQEWLPVKPEYVVDTSEYREIRGRLLAMENRRRKSDDPNAPVLRKAPSPVPPQGQDPDERPTIKRRELVD